MTKINDGGAAFPSEPTQIQFDHATGKYEPVGYAGMSLRDWFAGQALAGQLAFSPRDSFDKLHEPTEVAERMYEFADAMLAARKTEA